MTGRFVIYGAGGVGGVIGGCLAMADHPVSLIARGRHLEALVRSGLELHLADGRHHLHLEAVNHPAQLELTSDDVVVLAMKTQDTEAALIELAATAPPDLAVVCAQNGVENERLALRRFARVYAMCVMLPALHLEPGVVEGAGSPFHGVLDVGCYPGGVDDTARQIAAALTGAGFRSRADPAIMGHKYAKLRLNTRNALEAACGRAHRSSTLAQRVGAEALAVFTAAGIGVASADEEAARRDGFTIAAVDGRDRPGGSSWQSLARNAGTIEADHLNGEVVLLGRLHGVPTPVNEALRRLANRMAAEGAEPGSLSLDVVEELVGELEADQQAHGGRMDGAATAHDR